MEKKKGMDEANQLVYRLQQCVNNMNKTIGNLDSSQLTVEKNAFDAINSADTSLNLVKEGIECVDELLGKIDVLNKTVDNSSQNIVQMENLSKMIVGFADVIAGISNKTNMLSLNASIEAARAGEHGKGFSVVAGEIRSLASQSSKSSREITDTIESIQSFVKETVEAMNNIYRIVNEQNAMVSDVKEVFEKILKAAYISNDVAHNVEHEIAYQRDITDDVKTAIEEVSLVSKDAKRYSETI